MPLQKLIKVGVSSCLLGEKVRWDGQHKKNQYMTELLANYFEWIAVCPEVELGMGIPRETVRLVGDVDAPSMVGTKTEEDWTDRMNIYAKKKVKQLAKEQFCGYIFKKDSPSCGAYRVKVYSAKTGHPDKGGEGLFAKQFKLANPLIPVEEEGRLQDARLRDNFIERVFVYDRLQELMSGRFSRKKVVEFHSRHKYQLMAHSAKHYRELGVMVAHIDRYEAKDFFKEYSEKLMEAFGILATNKKSLQYLATYHGVFKKKLLMPKTNKIFWSKFVSTVKGLCL